MKQKLGGACGERSGGGERSTSSSSSAGGYSRVSASPGARARPAEQTGGSEFEDDDIPF